MVLALLFLGGRPDVDALMVLSVDMRSQAYSSFLCVAPCVASGPQDVSRTFQPDRPHYFNRESCYSRLVVNIATQG